MSETPPTKKQKRTRLSLEDKAKAALLLKNGSDAADVMKKFNVSRRTVSNLKASTDHLLRRAGDSAVSLELKTFRAARIPNLDSKIMQFVDYARAAKLNLSHLDLQHRAIYIRDKLLEQDDGSDSALRGALTHFTASKGWVDNFVKRHGVRSISVQGEAMSLYTDAGAKELENLHRCLRKFPPECIYKVEETNLFFKLLPRNLYTLKPKEGPPRFSNPCAMGLDDRVSAYLCANVIGSDKVPVALIGRDSDPSCFHFGRPAVPYTWQPNAWSDEVTLRAWFRDVFVPHVRLATTKPVALVVDRVMPSVSELAESSGQVSVIVLPAVCTSHAILAEMPVTFAFRILFRRLLVRALLNGIDSREQRRELNRDLRADLRGLNEGYGPHLLDATELAKESWASMSEVTIAQWWMKTHILPIELVSHLYITYSQAPGLSEDNCVRDMLSMCVKLKEKIATLNSFYEELGDINESNISRWLSVEDDQNMVAVMVEEAIERSERAPTRETSSTSNRFVRFVSQNRETSSPLPLAATLNHDRLSLADTHKLFSSLFNFAIDCDVPEAVELLRKAKQALMNATHSSMSDEGNSGTSEEEQLGDARGEECQPVRVNGIGRKSVDSDMPREKTNVDKPGENSGDPDKPRETHPDAGNPRKSLTDFGTPKLSTSDVAKPMEDCTAIARPVVGFVNSNNKPKQDLEIEKARESSVGTDASSLEGEVFPLSNNPPGVTEKDNSPEATMQNSIGATENSKGVVPVKEDSRDIGATQGIPKVEGNGKETTGASEDVSYVGKSRSNSSTGMAKKSDFEVTKADMKGNVAKRSNDSVAGDEPGSDKHSRYKHGIDRHSSETNENEGHSVIDDIFQRDVH